MYVCLIIRRDGWMTEKNKEMEILSIHEMHTSRYCYVHLMTYILCTQWYVHRLFEHVICDRLFESIEGHACASLCREKWHWSYAGRMYICTCIYM